MSETVTIQSDPIPVDKWENAATGVWIGLGEEARHAARERGLLVETIKYFHFQKDGHIIASATAVGNKPGALA